MTKRWLNEQFRQDAVDDAPDEYRLPDGSVDLAALDRDLPRKKVRKRFGILVTSTYTAAGKQRSFTHKLWYVKERDRDMAFHVYNNRTPSWWQEKAEKIER